MARPSKSARAKRLGRGLSSLIVNSSDTADDQHYQHVTGLPPVGRLGPETDPAGQPQPSSPQNILIEHIAPNPYQPRRDFPVVELAELADSIRTQGIIQPLIVSSSARSHDRPYTLIAGERRLRAATQAGLSEVPCVVRQATAEQMLEWAIIENIQREDLNPIDRAQAYRQYMDRFSLAGPEVGQRLGQPRTTTSNYLRLLDLPHPIQQMLSAGTLTFGHGKVLAGLAGDPGVQVSLARKTVKGSLSVRQLERLARTGRGGATGQTPSPPKAPHIRDVQEQLARAIGTKVTVRQGRARNSGRIIIEYYNLDDFDRIASQLGLHLEA